MILYHRCLCCSCWVIQGIPQFIALMPDVSVPETTVVLSEIHLSDLKIVFLCCMGVFY